MRKYDVVVIGAGNGGLAAATKVLNAGKTCLVCEKHNIPGGFATSFVRGRFEFEASLHEFNGIGTVENPGSTRILFDELGVSDKIDWIQLKDAYRLISLKEGYDFTMPFGCDAFAKANNALHPEGEKYIRHFFELCQQIRDAMNYLGASKGRPDPKVMMEKYPDYMRCASYTVNEAFEALGYPQIIVDNLNAYWCYLGADGNNLSFLHYANMIYSYISGGAAIPTLKSHELSLAFETRIHELGGDIWFNTEVTKILTDEEGHVCGVRLADGSEVETRHVVANCSPHVVYGRLLDEKDVPERALKLTNIDYCIGNLMNLPFLDNSFHFMLNCFALLDEKEFNRVLENEGYFIRVLPDTDHLLGIKEVLYENVIYNVMKEKDLKGFKLIDEIHIKDDITLKSKDEIYNLFTMTPYYYKSSKESMNKLLSKDSLKTRVSFVLLVYQKVGE
jgi:phytoene dehydrogenase-like protein